MEEAKIVVITPVRNEARFIEYTLHSMVVQTLMPVEWIIVDDGSTDETAAIIERYTKRYPWIRYIYKESECRRVGIGVVEAFYLGYEAIEEEDYNYICKMDGDLKFHKDYFKTLINIFNEDPQLGAASGKFYDGPKAKKLSRTSDEMVVGAFNFYRRECFEAVGGFVREVMWDGIAFHTARLKGWKTRSIDHPILNFRHLRLMGSSYQSIVTGRLRWGRGQYFMGTHPLYIVAVSIYRMVEYPFIIGGFCILLGYILAYLRGEKRYDSPGFREALHQWQFHRLKAMR